MDEVILNKAAITERCLRRIRSLQGQTDEQDPYLYEDALLLNLERACQAAIDLAMHVVSSRHLGVPQSRAEAFRLLEQAEVIPGALAQNLAKMVGFCNRMVHSYQDVDSQQVDRSVAAALRDLPEFCKAMGARISP